MDNTSQFSQTHQPDRNRSLAACLAIAGGLAVAALVFAQFDLNLQQIVRDTSLPGDFERFLKLMEIFAHGTGFFVSLLLISTLAPDFRRRIPRLIVAYAATGLIVNLVKLVVWRPRPLASEISVSDGSILNLTHISQSFPSGHSAAAISLAIGLSVLFPRGRIVFLGLALLACLQRIVFMAHWPSDVFAGLALGVGISGWVYFSAIADAVFTRFEVRPSCERIAMHRRAA